jgi:hypothetical protein
MAKLYAVVTLDSPTKNKPVTKSNSRKMNMKFCFLLFMQVIMLGCNSRNVSKPGTNSSSGKNSPPGFVQGTANIFVQTKVDAYSFDSVIVTTIFVNNDTQAIALYKPLLPLPGFTENIFALLEKSGYDRVIFTGQRREKYLTIEGSSSIFVNPNLISENIIVLKPHETLKTEVNIARKYNFEEFRKKGMNEFAISYINLFPLIKNNIQIITADSTDKQEKPTFIIVSVPQKQNPDSMRVFFKIPNRQEGPVVHRG